jgi:hypothetical protein
MQVRVLPPLLFGALRDNGLMGSTFSLAEGDTKMYTYRGPVLMGRFHCLGGVMAIVFVTNHDPNIDYRGLDKIANAVTHITSGRHFPGTYDRLLDDILQKLLHSQHSDYLCPTGDPLHHCNMLRCMASATSNINS